MTMKRAEDLIPWKVTDISLRPFKGMWSMNPSIHFDGATWRCVIRCSDYAMPGGVTVRSERAKRGESQTKNAMVIFEPARWRPLEIYKMREHDDLPRVHAGSVGYEDVRLFRTDRDGLQGIAASLHLKRSGRRREQLAEQVLLSFDDRYDIVEARPIRGDDWSSAPQKNWVPFDNTSAPRFLYAIDRGILFDDRGSLRNGIVEPSSRPRRARPPDAAEREHAEDRADDADASRERDERKRARATPQKPGAPGAPQTFEPPLGCEGLRGGSQLVRISEDAWLGIGHSMTFVEKLKYYWHVWYLVDGRGQLKAASAPMKLVPNGIEFAAGLAVDGDRAVVSFGVDDMECRIGETKLSAVLELLRPIQSRAVAAR